MNGFPTLGRKIHIPCNANARLPGEGGQLTVGFKELAEESPLSMRKMDRESDRARALARAQKRHSLGIMP